MPRFFNTAGPCNPKDHYMLPPESRLPGIRKLIDQKMYFVIHAPRQVGKTTCFQALAKSLTAEGRYAALCSSCQPGQSAGGDVERGVDAVLTALSLMAERLPAPLRPEPIQSVNHVRAESRLLVYLTRWAERCPIPTVLFLDEIDALLDETLLSVLHQLRTGYSSRPEAFPQSIALIGLRDVRDYKVKVRPDSSSLGTSSPFNIKVESLTIRNFIREEVAELYMQHTEETGQVFTHEALELAWNYTQGQPWLVNALARQIVEKDVPDKTVPITAAHMEQAKEALILRRDTHLDSLLERLKEPRVRRVIEPMLAGLLPQIDRLDDDAAYVEDLGLIAALPSQHVQIANAIYKEVIPRALSYSAQRAIVQETSWYVKADGTLDIDKLLAEFVKFWMRHAEVLLRYQNYPEAAPHLILMAFLQRVVNGGGTIDREYAVGSGRMDLCIRWKHPKGVQLEAIELKVWRDKCADPLDEGLEQLTGYLVRLGLKKGALVIFDRRTVALALEERCTSIMREHQGFSIQVIRL